MADETFEAIEAEIAIAAASRVATPDQLLRYVRSLMAGASLAYVMPTDGSETVVSVGSGWTLLAPYDQVVKTGGLSISSGLVMFGGGSDGWYEATAALSCVPEVAMELALRATRGGTTYLVQGARVLDPGACQHPTIRRALSIDVLSPRHSIEGDAVGLYARTGGTAGDLRLHSVSFELERKRRSSEP